MTARGSELEVVSEDLTTRWLGRVHEHHAVLGSTNDRAAQWARGGAPHGAMVTADEQTAGRGRRGRVWASAPGQNLYVSVVLRPTLPGPFLGALGLAVAVGLRRGLSPDVTPELKWPNDLLVGGRKLAGILCECRWAGADPEAVVGWGINVGQREFPAPLDEIATSLALLGVERSRAAILRDVLAGLESCLDVFFEGGFAPLRDEYVAGCAWLGHGIGLRDGEHRRRVVALDVERDGRLLVDDGGVRRRVDAAEIEWVDRP